MVDSLSTMFQLFLDTEDFPTEWKKGLIVLIPKRGQNSTLENFRGLTLSSNVMVKLIEHKIREYLEEYNILGETQGGFRKDRRVEDQIFTLTSIAALNKSTKTKTYIAFLDASKCFDRVWRDGIFYQVAENEFQEKLGAYCEIYTGP